MKQVGSGNATVLSGAKVSTSDGALLRKSDAAGTTGATEQYGTC